MRANFEKPETVKFRFMTIKDGNLICENLIELITRQLYPTEGFWACIDTKTLEPVDILEIWRVVCLKIKKTQLNFIRIRVCSDDDEIYFQTIS